MSNLRSVFTGFYGMGNFGDDLFAEASLDAANQFWRKMDHRILAPPQDKPAGGYVVASRFAKSWNYGWQGRLLRCGYAARELARTDLVTFAGGSLFSSESSLIRDLFCYAGRTSRIRVAAVGVSIGPFRRTAEEKKTRALLRALSFISVRDGESYEIARAMDLPSPVVRGRDLAALHLKHHGGGHRTALEKPTIGVSFCNFSSREADGQDVALEITNALINFRKQMDAKIKIFVLNGHPAWGDDWLSCKMEALMTAAGLDVELVRHSTLGVTGIWKTFATCQAFLSVRLHGGIAAYLNGIPFTLFEYHKKCSDFLKDIGQPSQLRLGINASAPEIGPALNAMLSGPSTPGVNPMTYAADSDRHFKQAPWATP